MHSITPTKRGAFLCTIGTCAFLSALPHHTSVNRAKLFLGKRLAFHYTEQDVKANISILFLNLIKHQPAYSVVRKGSSAQSEGFDKNNILGIETCGSYIEKCAECCHCHLCIIRDSAAFVLCGDTGKFTITCHKIYTDV